MATRSCERAPVLDACETCGTREDRPRAIHAPCDAWRRGSKPSTPSTRTRCWRSAPPRKHCAVTSRALSTKSAYASAPYRELRDVPEKQREAWAQRDVGLHAEMRKRVPAALAHNGEESFDDHLVGVQSVLRAWGAPEHITDAALFHSIYGTEGFSSGFLYHFHKERTSRI